MHHNEADKPSLFCCRSSSTFSHRKARVAWPSLMISRMTHLAIRLDWVVEDDFYRELLCSLQLDNTFHSSCLNNTLLLK